MATQIDLDAVPAWAYKWCYYFAAIAVVGVFGGLFAIFFNRTLGFGLTFAYLIAAVAQAATALTLFWMCRTSLRTTNAAHIQVEGASSNNAVMA